MRRLLRAGSALAPILFLCASAALASEGGGHEAMPLDKILWEMGIKILDVGIIVFFGFKFLSKPITQAMADRSAKVRAAVEEATAGRRDAEARLREIQEKNSRLEAEIQQLVDLTGVGIEREQAILHEEAQAAAARISQHASETIRQEVAKARAELHRDAAALAVRLAEEHVRSSMTAADQSRLAADYFKEMEAAR